MDFSFFPENYQKSLDNVNLSKLYEIRLRLNFPVKINVDGINLYLCENGGTFFKNNALICEKTDIEHVIKQVTENSFYAFNENIKNAFLTTKSGFRIGLAGECVFENENVQTIKNISSLNIRISHEIIGCSNNLIPYIINNDNFLNSLIISPPFAGKTTILKDLTRFFNEKYEKSILVIDERGEFINVKGENIDTLSYSSKEFAFDCGIRSLSPSIVITDELSCKNDWNFVKKAIISGIKVFASIHCDNIEHLKQKEFFIDKLFDRYIFLNKNDGFGKIDSVFDREFNIL